MLQEMVYPLSVPRSSQRGPVFNWEYRCRVRDSPNVGSGWVTNLSAPVYIIPGLPSAPFRLRFAT
jgi:formyltetrahydrofolate synthetase